MTRLLLHIGHPKTGTTALQSVLSANAKKLLDEASILYPTRTTPSEYKHAFAIPWLLGLENEAIRRRGRCKNEHLKKLSQRYWESLVQEIRDTRPEHLILSAEGFWILRKASEEKIGFFREAIQSIASEVSVAGYLKSPASYFTSMINQKLRNYREVFLPRPNYYRSAIQAWESVGFNHYSWRIFDRSQLSNGDIIDDFCTHHLPPTFQAESLNREGVEQANSSVSNEALIILEELVQERPILRENIYDHRRSKVVDILRDADRSVGGQCRPSLTEQAKASIIRRSHDLDWLRERGLNFPDVDPVLINTAPREDDPECFTCIADYCPINAERLGALRSVSARRIDALFNPKTRRLWPLFSNKK
ncbi:hypothetical protein KUL97_10120 [Synechococcus sp. HK05]|uniref:hypothetical protein n=1 Tax=Synechococcus sp. HK05 TaxID=2725975 RepID=UPI001C3815F6|nr:hypothetical protein [Synechococcus sp. HK05]MBV2352060.1 hypothetical protein [Synechococcus sp. HK05]